MISDGEQRACGAAAAAGLRAQRNGDQSEGETCEGESEALVEFDAGIAPARAAVVPEIGKRAFGIAEDADLAVIERGEFDGPVALREGGDGILIGVFALKFVGGAAVQMQFELALGGFGDDDGAFGEGDARAAFGAGLKQENAVPVGAAGGDVVDVEDQVREALVEDAGLHLERNL